jgi:transcriptional regulator with XRE-family HTH domain
MRHNSRMAKKQKIRWFAREWRKAAGLNLERAADRLSMAVSYLSDLEKGKRRFNQDHLEAMAEAYGTDPASLIMRDPSDPSGLWSIWDSIPAQDRPQAAKILETFKKTGTLG